MRQGRWDILRGAPPFVDERRGIDLGGAFNNHNVEKLGITLNLRTERGKRAARASSSRISDVVTENFAAGVMARLGFSYDELRRSSPTSSTCRTPASARAGPYSAFKTWGPIVQAVSGLTFSAGSPDRSRRRLGLLVHGPHGRQLHGRRDPRRRSIHRNRTGEGQWVDMSCTEAGATLAGPDLLDYTVNGRPLRRAGSPRLQPQRRAGDGAARHLPGARRRRLDRDRLPRRRRLGAPRGGDRRAVGRDAALRRRSPAASRRRTRSTTRSRRGRATRDAFATAAALRAAGVPAAAVARPEERIDHDPGTSELGPVADGAPPRDGRRARRRPPGAPVGAPTGRSSAAHRASASTTTRCFGELLGLDDDEIERCATDGVDRDAGPRSTDCACVELAHEHAAFAGKLLARPRRRRDRGRAARRPPEPRRTGRSSTTSTGSRAQPLVVALQHDEARRRARPRHADAAPSSSARSSPRADIVLEGEPTRPAGRARPRPHRPARRARRADLGRRSRRSAAPGPRAARARDRPHAARRRRPGLELRLRRPLAAAGARRREPGVPHRAARSR